MPNTVGTHLEWEERMPVLTAETAYPDQLLAYGLTAADVAQQLQFQFSGATVSQLREDIRSVSMSSPAWRGHKLYNQMPLS